MIKSKDKRIEIEVASSPGSLILQPSDWSIVNLPTEQKEAENLFSNLYNMPVASHVCLVLNRQRRKHRIESIRNIEFANDKFQYLETVSVTYEKPSSCSNNGFLPLAEVGFLFYKGDMPDAKRTAWFSGEKHTNATNLWDVAAQDGEDGFSYYQKFNWEMNLLMKSMIGNLSSRRFFYGLPVSKEEIQSIYAFCKEHELKCNLVVESQKEANELIQSIPR